MTIPEPRFYLKDRNSKDETLIYLQAKYTFETQQRLMLSTGEKINPLAWNDLKQRAIIVKNNVANSDINMWLDKLSQTFKSIFRSYTLDGIVPTASMIKEKMEQVLNLIPKVSIGIHEKKAVTLNSFIESYIEESKSFKSYGTIKHYKVLQRRIIEYGKFCNTEFNFEDITLEWRSGFIKFLQGRGICKSTEGKYIKDVKVMLNAATERDINHNLAFKSKGFSKPHENSTKVFLDMDEIKRINSLDLSDDKQLDITRDYFIISCLTSLRYSDFTRIKSEHVKDNFIKMVTIKTASEVIIPMSPMVKTIFQKYNFDLPKAPCNQLFNRYLKEICKLAELNEPIHITKTIGGIKRTFVIEKYKLISSHSGRRSLISNCILEGINTSSIQLISGHKSLKTFQGYVRISQQQNAEVLLKLEKTLKLTIVKRFKLSRHIAIN